MNGVLLAPGVPSISKLLCADDVLLICGACRKEVEVLLNCVELFCKWSGQTISIEKSGWFVSKGVHSQFGRFIKSRWSFKSLPQCSRYLGAPLFLSSNKSKDFNFILEKLEARTSGWKSKSLSWMGRATLIKAVALSTTIYTLATFKLPKKLCNEMDVVVRRFLWNLKKDSKSFWSPLAWSKLRKPLSMGGLGFRTFENFNKAMITKLAWWVLSDRDSFCVKVIKVKYKVGNNWLRSDPAKSASFTWKGVESAKPLMARGACKLVGSGDRILVWDDPWIPSLPSFLPHPAVPSNSIQCLVVSQLMNHSKTAWDLGKQKFMFDDETIKAILNIPK